MKENNRVEFDDTKQLSKEEKKDRRKRRLVKARNAVALVSLAAVMTAAEVAVANQLPKQKSEPSCYSIKLMECPWPLVTPTHTPVPEHEVTPNIKQQEK